MGLAARAFNEKSKEQNVNRHFHNGRTIGSQTVVISDAPPSFPDTVFLLPDRFSGRIHLDFETGSPVR